jgi:hypothetical protein
MKGYWDSLRPFEKRVVVGAGVLFFVVLNFVFVIPHFSDLSAVHRRREDAEAKLRKYNTEIQQIPTYKRLIGELESEGGSSVAQEDQHFQFQNTVTAQAAKSHVRVTSSALKPAYQTNQFFLELSQGITLESEESQLVDFLYNLGSADSLIRVRDLSLRPDPPRQKLVAQVKLVASFQKNPSAKPVAGPAARTAATPASMPLVRSEPKTVKAQTPNKKSP